MERLKRATVDAGESLSKEELQETFELLVKHLLKLFSDPIEKCRELSIGLVSEYVISPTQANYCTHIVEIAVPRAV